MNEQSVKKWNNSMEPVVIPEIASREVIAEFRENVQSFKEESKHLWRPRPLFLVKPGSSRIENPPRKPVPEDDPFLQIHTIKDLRAFFKNAKEVHPLEFSFTELSPLLNLVYAEHFSLKICIAAYVRSLTLMIQYLFEKDAPTNDRVDKNLVQKAVGMLHSIRVNARFYPNSNDKRLIDCGLVDCGVASTTAITCGKRFVYLGYPNGRIVRYKKWQDTRVRERIAEASKDLGRYSLALIEHKLLVVSQSAGSYFYDLNLGKWGQLKIKNKMGSSTPSLMHPTVTDGYYLYSVECDNQQAKVRVYQMVDDVVAVVRSIKLKRPLGLPADMSIHDIGVAANGSAISFCWRTDMVKSVRTFSLITGECMTKWDSKLLTGEIYAWCFDSATLSQWIVSDDGLLLMNYKSSIPYWKLGLRLMTPELGTNIKKYFIENLYLFLLHFIGGDYDFPLSQYDSGILEALIIGLSKLTGRPDKELDLVQTFLACLQVKLRCFVDGNMPLLTSSLLRIMTDDFLEPVRPHAAFLFLSNLSLFIPTWDETSSNVLTAIISKNVHMTFLVRYIPYDLPVERLGEGVIEQLTLFSFGTVGLAKEVTTRILQGLQMNLVDAVLAGTAPRAVFDKYVPLVMAKFIENWSASLIGGEAIENTIAFAVLEKLVCVLVHHLKAIHLSLASVDKFLAVALLQQMSPDLTKKCANLFDRVFFLAFYSILKLSKSESFIKYDGEKAFSPAFEIPEDCTEEERLLYTCVNLIPFYSLEDARKFVEEMKGSVPLDQLKEKVSALEPLLPQPVRKIKAYLAGGEFQPIPFRKSALSYFLNTLQWISKISRQSYKLTISMFLNKMEKYQEDLLCLPREQLSKFAANSPMILYLPKSVILHSQYHMSPSSLISMDLHELIYCLDSILLCVSEKDADAILAPFLSLSVSNEYALKKTIVLALIGFSKTSKKYGEEIFLPLTKCFYLKNYQTLEFLIRMITVMIERDVCKEAFIFEYLLDIIGCGLLNEREVFPNVDSTINVLVYCFTIITFCKRLLNTSAEFRNYIYDSLLDFQGYQRLAVLAITNNMHNLPSVGSFIRGIDCNCTSIEGTVKDIDRSGHVVRLVSGDQIDIRMCRTLSVSVVAPFDAKIFEKYDNFVDFFDIMSKEMTVVEKFYFFASLREFALVDEFAEKFFSSRFLKPELIVIGLQAPGLKFIRLAAAIPMSGLSEFTFSDNQGKIGSDGEWSILTSTRKAVNSSPMHPFVEQTVYMLFARPIQLSILSKMTEDQVVVHHETLTVKENTQLKVALLPSEAKVEVSFGDVVRKYMILPSCYFVFFKIEGNTNLVFKYKAESKPGMTTTSTNAYRDIDIGELTFSEFENCNIPLSAPFVRAIMDQIASLVMNQCLIDIYSHRPSLLTLDQLVDIVHVLLRSRVNPIHLCRVRCPFIPVDEEISDVPDILRNVDPGVFIDKYIDKFEEFIKNDEYHWVWKNNNAAFSMSHPYNFSKVIIFDNPIVAVGDEPRRIQLKPGTMVLPLCALDHSGIELVKCVRILVLLARIFNLPEKLDRVRDLVNQSKERGSPVFNSPDICTIDEMMSS